MKRVSKRIGKFEIRSTGDLKNDFEVLKWFPNEYYGKEDQYIKISSEHYRDPKLSCGSIHKSCFESPEHCMVIGFINVYPDTGWILERTHPCLTESEEKDEDLVKLLSFFERFREEFCKAIE